MNFLKQNNNIFIYFKHIASNWIEYFPVRSQGVNATPT